MKKLLLLLAFFLIICCGVQAEQDPEPTIDLEALQSIDIIEPDLEPIDPPATADAFAFDLVGTDRGWALSWLEPRGEGHRLVVARLEDGEWSEPRTIHESDAFFANWADTPRLISMPGGDWAAAWPEMLGEETYAYGLQLATAPELDGPWESLGLLHDDYSETEHGFASFLEENGRMRAFWLDGRASGEGGAMQLRTATFDSTEVSASELLDDRVCDCCQTATAMGVDGPIVVYRDRSEAEIRDMSIIRSTTEGWSDSAPVSVDSWTMPGCPVNGPAVAFNGAHGAAAWYTAAGELPRVRVSFSSDSGASFGPAIELDVFTPIGRVDLKLDGSDALVSWLRDAEVGAELVLTRVHPDSSFETTRLATTAGGRGAGVPRMARSNDNRLAIAWLEVSDAGNRLHVAILVTQG